MTCPSCGGSAHVPETLCRFTPFRGKFVSVPHYTGRVRPCPCCSRVYDATLGVPVARRAAP